jgi:hypothetical protein
MQTDIPLEDQKAVKNPIKGQEDVDPGGALEGIKNYSLLYQIVKLFHNQFQPTLSFPAGSFFWGPR